MKFADDPLFVALMNHITNAASSVSRISLTVRLVQPFARLFTAPPETLEQLVTKLEQEIVKYRSKEYEGVISPEANVKAEHHVAYLKTFLKHRAAMIESLGEFGTDL